MDNYEIGQYSDEIRELEEYQQSQFFDTSLYDNLIKTNLNTYTNVLTLSEIKEGKKNNIRVNIVWNNIEENNTEQPKSNRPAMSPEQFKQYQEFCKKFPEFDMRTDYAFTGDTGMNVSTVNPAQRVGWGISDRYSSR